MSTAPYDPVRRLAQLGLGVLAVSVRDGTEVTIHVRGGGSYCVYRPKLVINVDPAGKILLGDPMGSQLALDPARIRVSSGVSQLPANPGITWERQREV
jgi:hypothetical protein